MSYKAKIRAKKREDRYRWYGGGAIVTGSVPSAHITVQDIDGVPSFTSIDILQFDQADGFTISQPLGGTARIDFTPTAGLADPGGNGVVIRTAVNTTTNRTLTGTANRIVITNGDGVAGAPTFDIGTDVVTLTGSQTLTNKTLTTPIISGAISFPDDVRQTFNPGTTVSGLNVGSQAGDVSTPTNGDIWYDSTNNLLRARINGATISLGAGGGGSPGGSSGDFQINNGAGGFAAGVIVQGTNGRVIASPTATSSGALSYFRIVTPADTAQTADTEMPGIVIGGNSSGATVTRTGADGTTYALQREVRIVHPTYAFAGATTVTNAVTFAITDAPVQGANATLSNRRALKVEAGQSEFPAGSSSVPAILFNADGFGNSGIFSETGTSQCFCSNGSYIAGFAAGGGGSNPGLVMMSGSAFGWSSANTVSSTDLSLVRHAAGVLRLQTSFGSGAAGQLLVGGSGDTIAAQAHIFSGDAARVGLRVNSASASTAVNFISTHIINDTATADITAQWIVNSSGTAATGFGQTHQYLLETTTTDSTLAAETTTSWSDATHASRKGRVVHSVYDTAVREVLRLQASGTAAMIGFLGASASVRQTAGANLTNSVSVGGTDNIIDNWTDLNTYSTDAAAIRNAVYQLARTLKIVNDALRLYGLLT